MSEGRPGVAVRRRNAGQPRAWQVPKMDTAEAEVKAIDEAARIEGGGG